LLREHGGNPIYRRLRQDADRKARPLYAAQLRSTQEVIFLAERGGKTVGILRCVDTLGSPLLDPSRYGYVSSVYVRPAARRSGVLRALLEAAERWARGRGLTELRLHNAADNALAVAAWGELGFEVVEQLRLRPIPPGSAAPMTDRSSARTRGPRLADEGGGARWR
jgi:aminoglycoside 6'-N-acetyltransferase I